jgi:hypothetical protein
VIRLWPVKKGFYLWTRDLHLYLGLFASPFLVVFAATVFYLNHDHPPTAEATRVTSQRISVPTGIEEAQGMERVHLAQEILAQLRLTGEINFIRYVANERRLVIPVVKPGVDATVDVNLAAGTASVALRQTTLWETLSFLHRMPGPHNASIRGNWFWTGAWRWFADATVYLVMFLSISGIYLWLMMRTERKAGLILLFAGAASLAGILYAVIA